MNGEIPNAPNVAQPPKGKKGLVFEIIFVLISLVLIFGALNYFKILRLSKIFPNYLGFLPHEQSKQYNNVATQQSNNVSSILRTKLSCPSVKEFCEKAKGILKDGAYVGIGYKLSSGSPILAAFDGNLTATTSAFSTEIDGKVVKDTFKTVYLDNLDLRLRAIYFFRAKAKDLKTGKFSKGEQIVISNGKAISIYDNNSLIFSIIQGYPGSNAPTILNKENFE